MKTYYGLLKSGDLRRYEKPPKRLHVAMESMYSRQTSLHMLVCGKIKKNVLAYCGYDRGPKLDRLIKKMLS